MSQQVPGMHCIPWTKINDSYYWDGAFVHNTPLKAVSKTTKAEKIIYVTDVFPLKQEKLPTSMPETYHRIRDLLFTDRSIGENKMISNMVKSYISLFEQMHEIIASNIQNESKDTELKLKLDKIESEYNNLVHDTRGLIDRIIHIERVERPERQFIFEDADFSIDTVKELIRQGEEDAENALNWE